MRVDEGFDDQSSAGVEQVGVRPVIVPIGVGRPCHDRTELGIVDVDIPSSVSSSEGRLGDDHSRSSLSCVTGMPASLVPTRAKTPACRPNALGTGGVSYRNAWTGIRLATAAGQPDATD
jgi:hypothetical protein